MAFYSLRLLDELKKSYSTTSYFDAKYCIHSKVLSRKRSCKMIFKKIKLYFHLVKTNVKKPLGFVLFSSEDLPSFGTSYDNQGVWFDMILILVILMRNSLSDWVIYKTWNRCCPRRKYKFYFLLLFSIVSKTKTKHICYWYIFHHFMIVIEVVFSIFCFLTGLFSVTKYMNLKSILFPFLITLI